MNRFHLKILLSTIPIKMDRLRFLKYRRPILTFFVLAAAASPFADGSEQLPKMDGMPTADPESVGMSHERLKRLNTVMQGYIDRQESAGALTLIARKGKVVHFSAIGNRDVEKKAPIKQDTIFRIASMTKPITSVALMMLYEEGHFQLRDPISKWLPEFEIMEVAIPAPAHERLTGRYKTIPAKKPITIQQVLTHTSGLSNTYRGITQPDFVKAMADVPRSEPARDRIKRLAKLPLNFHPGEHWEYGQGTTVVGVLVEEISGMTLDTFFRERIFKPLDMPDTHFYLPETKLDRFAALYKPGESNIIELIEAPTKDSRFVQEPHTYFAGAGGLVSTARDYFRFQQMMLNGGELDGVRLLGRKTVEFMTVNHIGDKPIWLYGAGYGFGLGYGIVTDWGASSTSRSTGSYFWGGAFGTLSWVDPREELVCVFMQQLRPYTQINVRKDVISMTYQAITD